MVTLTKIINILRISQNESLVSNINLIQCCKRRYQAEELGSFFRFHLENDTSAREQHNRHQLTNEPKRFVPY